ncbi:MAG: 30S ribosomal protein S16 [Planctomycetaceae bacterium]|nr:30S ribosomal protein S16 [Planctomycetaceae bacterium]
MAVRIRLTRTGRKNLPSYRIAVYDGRTRRDGPSLGVIGWYNPLNREEGKGFKVDAEALRKWIHDGATVTLAVRQLLGRQGVEVPAAPRTGKGPAKDGGKRPTKRALFKSKDRQARLRKKKAKQVGRRALRAKRAAAKAAAAATAAGKA